MRKFLTALLCISILSVSALAVNVEDYEVINEDGTSYIDIDAYYYAVASEKVMTAGLALDPYSYWVTDWLGNLTFDNAAFEADYNAALEAQAAAQAPAESEGVEDDQLVDDPALDPVYPDGSYTDEAGNVFSAEGELLSPGTTPAAPAGTYRPLPDVLSDTEDTSQAETSDPVDNVDTDPADTVDVNNSVVVLGINQAPQPTGLKALIVQIFGEYEPLTLSMLDYPTEILGVEGYASADDMAAAIQIVDGIAGLDFEWIAGVYLFGIMLYCFMKLLGGILK